MGELDDKGADKARIQLAVPFASLDLPFPSRLWRNFISFFRSEVPSKVTIQVVPLGCSIWIDSASDGQLELRFSVVSFMKRPVVIDHIHMGWTSVLNYSLADCDLKPYSAQVHLPARSITEVTMRGRLRASDIARIIPQIQQAVQQWATPSGTTTIAGELLCGCGGPRTSVEFRFNTSLTFTVNPAGRISPST